MRGDVPEPLVAPQQPPYTTRRLLESPILLLILFHSALRQELADLRRVAAESSDHGRDVAIQLRRRFEFLKIVYKYHSAAEDEVFFLALDVHIKNVVSAYRLEHRSTDDLVDSVFHYLDVLAKEDEDTSKPFQELVYFISTLQSTICIHMDKEEEQIFPLLLQQFSAREQASLVWQFMCSVPMTLLEDFLQWMISFLSSDERMDVLHCVKEVVPKEILLQEVVISWLDGKKQTYCGDYGKYRKGALLLNARTDFQQILNLYISEGHNGEGKPSTPTNVGCKPLESVHIWHKAFQKDLIEVLEELYTIRSSNNFSSLIAVTVQLKFFADVLIFYSKALDKIFYPICIEFAKDYPPTSYQQFLDDCQIEDLQRMLHRKAENVMAVKDFVDKLSRNLEVCIMGINRYLMSIEAEVFPMIVTNCNNKMQQWLLYTSLEMMPLGLLKCTIIWFSTHLSEDESKSILCSIKQGAPTVNKSLPPLLHEWVRVGYSGKTSVEKFRKELREIFSNRCFVLSEHKDDSGLSCFELDTRPNNVLNLRPLDTVLVAKGRNSVSTSSSSASSSNKKYGTLYSSGINFHVFFPQTLKTSSPLSTLSGDNNQLCSFLHLETRPVDHIFLFHKALKKDLEYLVSISAMLAENDALLMDFHRRFHLVQFLYQIHSDSEDEIAFPALEAKGKIQNSRCSYSIDHKLEIEHFNKVSFILGQISELCLSSSTGDVDSRCRRKQVYRELCVKLHDMCKSMNRILCDHVNNEEIELWPLFREHLSLEEQEKIIGCMLGRTRAETLQEMIPWLMASLTTDEQNAMMSLWRKATKNTMFDQWLGEWWEGMNRYEIAKFKEESTVPPPWTGDPLEVVSAYLTKDLDNHQANICDEGCENSKGDAGCQKMMQCETLDTDCEEDSFSKNQNAHQSSVCRKKPSEVKKKSSKTTDVTDQTDKAVELVHTSQSYRQQEGLLKLSQEELEASIRRIYRDSTLDPRMKSFIIQNLLMSRWIDTQTKSHPDVVVLNDEQEIPGRCPSYRDPIKSVFGCQHYKRNCKLVAACCNKLYSCRHCHDEVADHSMDRKATTLMMCMKCLIIQPISPTCSTVSCNNLSMARYYCRICKFFDDERQIYHCPYCNLCRVGKGLGIDYFHCMNCNACMSRSLSVHICREKCFEDNCPICHEYIFTSSSPVKALPCGHLMHSSCFQDYTCSNYTCPICSKSLGDMQVYFGMLDALLAEEKMPEEYSGKTQVILCNDCEKRGTASFHWLYHKCSHCGSYNTRLL